MSKGLSKGENTIEQSRLKISLLLFAIPLDVWTVAIFGFIKITSLFCSFNALIACEPE